MFPLTNIVNETLKFNVNKPYYKINDLFILATFATGMRIFRDLNQLPTFRDAVITIGSFDGVHRGHQRLIRRINQLARETGGESILITFHPHPRQIVYPQDKSLRLLTSLDEKIKLFERFGVKNLVIVPFTVEFSQLHPKEYIERFIWEKFKPRYIVIGYDHRFGMNRGGNVTLLKSYERQYGFEVIEIEKQELDDIAISSTKIRKALQSQEILTANELLNHYYSIEGVVIKGDQIGAKLGFPTANMRIDTPMKLLPPPGIYACYAYYQDVRFDAMLYIGDRPTLKSEKSNHIEVHIIDFSDVIYGRRLRIELVAYIRADQTFASLHALRSQIKLDQDDTLQILRNFEERLVEKNNPLKASAVILNYNGEKHLKAYLPNIRLVLNNEVDLVVADNASSDGSLDYLRRYHPDVDCIELSQNYGFAGGYNQALAEIDRKYIGLLNSDVEFDENWITPIIAFMEDHPEIAICQPGILDMNQRKTFEYAGAAGGWLDALGYPFCEGRIFDSLEDDQGQYDAPHEIFWASGAACVIRKEAFDQIGGFDANYFAHQEEIDLCWRLKRAGYKIFSYPKYKVYHLGGGTLDYQSPRKTFLNFRNNLATIYKNESTAMLFWMLPARIGLDLLAAIQFLAKGKLMHTMAILRAYGTFFWQLLIWYDHRKNNRTSIQRNRIGKPNLHKGRYDGFVAWDYFILRRKKFQQIPINPSRKDASKY